MRIYPNKMSNQNNCYYRPSHSSFVMAIALTALMLCVHILKLIGSLSEIYKYYYWDWKKVACVGLVVAFALYYLGQTCFMCMLFICRNHHNPAHCLFMIGFLEILFAFLIYSDQSTRLQNPSINNFQIKKNSHLFTIRCDIRNGF